MSMQYAQPLSWEARIRTSSRSRTSKIDPVQFPGRRLVEVHHRAEEARRARVEVDPLPDFLVRRARGHRSLL
jgi:hypothetical protein